MMVGGTKEQENIQFDGYSDAYIQPAATDDSSDMYGKGTKSQQNPCAESCKSGVLTTGGDFGVISPLKINLKSHPGSRLKSRQNPALGVPLFVRFLLTQKITEGV